MSADAANSEQTMDGLTEDGPVVGARSNAGSKYVIVGSFAALAVVLFLMLNGARGAQSTSLVKPDAVGQSAAPPPPPLYVPAPPAPTPPPAPVAPEPVAAAPVAALPPPPPPSDAIPADLEQRLHAPAVVVDLQSPQAPAAAAPARGAQSALLASNTASPAGPPGDAGESEEVTAPENSGAAAPAAATNVGGAGHKEAFAPRVSGTLPEPAIATQLSGLSRIITQGTTIQGVLETALNSDLPGYTRAVVSRDVRSFDGKAVLIPRGSRLIGQYRSAMSLGQSRVFVIWTRVIRPDGVSIQIVSPGGDALGRGGLSGDVDSHFFTRFGGSILLSVLNGGITALAGTPSTQISIGSPAAALGTAATAVVPPSTDVMPTVKVKQGEAITIFVSRDLDFSAVRSLP